MDGEYVIDNTPIPNREAAKQSFRHRQEAQQKQMKELMQKNPEAAEKVLSKQLGGGKH